MVNFSSLIILVHLATCFARISPRDRRAVVKEPGSNSTWISGLRVETTSHTGFSGGIFEIIYQDDTTIRLFGSNIRNGTKIKFTQEAATKGMNCGGSSTGVFEVNFNNETEESGTVLVPGNKLLPYGNKDSYYICVLDPDTDRFYHQGKSPFTQIRPVDKYPIALWIQIIIVIILQLLSGIFSGLNLGLLSLDPTELRIVASVGRPKEKKYAKNIIPLRKKGNFLLCSLVIGNVLVNSILAILMESLTSGLYAIILSTIGIVIFGEIVPQALCNRFGLAIGSATRYITYVVMGVTGVISYPLSRILDCLLGREIGTVYDRERLVELIRVTMDHNLLESDEVNIISGALELKRKTVKQIMTPLSDVFMIPCDAVLDFDTVSEIIRNGYTRVPVYDVSRTNVVALLNIKDLALVDPDDNTPVKTVCKFYNHHVITVFDDTTLDVMLEEFKRGRSHMAFVQRIITESDGDPFYETVGVVTLEDVIEEVIQSEIEDETDVTADNRTRLRRSDFAMSKMDAGKVFTGDSGPQYQTLITPQLQMATFQFLSTTLEPFSENLITPTILRRLLRHSESARFLRIKGAEPDPPCLYTAGKAADYFILILEGRVEVKVGYERLLFQSGPFTYFGVSVLSPPAESSSPSQSPSIPGLFVPDFTVYPVTDLLHLYITRAQYLAAFRASLVERSSMSKVDQEEGGYTQPQQLTHLSITYPNGNAPTTGAHPASTSLLRANSNISLVATTPPALNSPPIVPELINGHVDGNDIVDETIPLNRMFS